jgi:hypothetical protein
VGTRVIPVVAERVDFERVPRWMARLDWLDFRESAPEREIAWSKLVIQLNSRGRPRKVPFMLDDLSADFVRRPDLLEPIVGAITDESHAVSMAAAVGIGGYGKTTLLRAACHDLRVRAAYDDGSLWVTLGEQVGEQDRINKIKDLVHAITGESPNITTIEAATSELRKALGDRYILVVIDDVWKAEHLAPFLEGGPNCARLISTRYPHTLPKVLGDNLSSHLVDRMSPEEAETLLGSGVIDSVNGDLLATLAQRLGGWPLLLKLVNAALYQYVKSEGYTLAEAVQEADLTLTRRGLTAFDEANPEQRDKAVAAALGASIDLLTQKEQEHYHRLAIFPAGITVSVATLSRLWQLDDFDTRQICRKLARSALLLKFDQAGIRLHDVVRQYLRDACRLWLRGWNNEFLDSYQIDNWHELPLSEPYLWRHLVFHLLQGERTEELSSLFNDDRWMRARVVHDDYTYNGFVADLSVAWEQWAMPRALEQISRDEEPTALVDCFRYAFIRTSVNSLAGNYVPTLVAEAVRRDLWPAQRALSLVANIPDDEQRLELCSLLLETSQLTGEQRNQAERQGWAAAMRKATSGGFPTIARLTSHLAHDMLSDALESALSIPRNAPRAHVLAALIPSLAGEQKDRAITIGLQSAHAAEDSYDRVSVLKEVAVTLDWNRLQRWSEIVDLSLHEHFKVLEDVIPKLEGMEQIAAILEVMALANEHKMNPGWVIKFLLPYLPPNCNFFKRLLESYKTLPKEPESYVFLVRLIPQLEESLLETVADIAEESQDHMTRAQLFFALFRRLPGQHLDRAIEAALQIEAPVWVAIHMLGEIRSFTDGDRSTALQRQIDLRAREYRSMHHRDFAFPIERIAPYVSNDILSEWLEAAIEPKDLEKLWFVRAASVFMTRTHPDLGANLADIAVEVTLTIREDQGKAMALDPLVSHIREEHIGHIFKQVVNLTESIGSRSSGDPMYGYPRLSAIASLLPYLDTADVATALEIVKASKNSSARTFALIACCRRLEGPARKELLAQVSELVSEARYDRDWLLSELVPLLDGSERDRAFHEFLRQPSRFLQARYNQKVWK